MARPLPDEVVAAVGPIRPAGDGWMAKCPAHDDRNPSLSLTVTADDKLLVHCHADCPQDAVLAALKLDPAVLNGPGDDREVWTPRGPATAVYDYRAEDGRLLYQVCRTATKEFPQRRPDPTRKSGWTWSLGGVRRVLFRLPELEAAQSEGRSVCITEGEKDALALVAHGRVATCNSGGAGKWRPEFAGHFVGLDVTIFADKDKPGQAHARDIAATLEDVAARVWIVEACEPYKDIAEQLGAGRRPVNDVVVTHDPTTPARVDLRPGVLSFLAGIGTGYDWLVPELLERGERFMLTGFEGLGKSVWLRQVAVCLSVGLNPVTFARIDPLKVLLIDCENGARQVARGLQPLVDQAARSGRPCDDTHLIPLVRPEGLNLADADDATWLLEQVVAVKPDLLVIGPTYRLHYGNPNDEETARQLTGAVDAARVEANCAVLMEHHAGHGDHANRSVRPVGSSLYMRWPEFGYGIKPVVDGDDQLNPTSVRFVPWRGDREERKWPSRLWRGGTANWPWVDYDPETTGLRSA